MNRAGDGFAALPQTVAALQAGIERGEQRGAQLFVSRAGQPLANLAVGDAAPGVPLRPDTLLLWLSSVKPVAAVAIAQLLARGLLTLDQPVADVIPAFAAGGKAAITLRHVLTHTGGFRRLPAETDDMVAAVCALPLEPAWQPGQRAGYHAATGWIILGELIRRTAGRSFDEYARAEIFLPLGLEDCWAGLPTARHAAYGGRIGVMERTDGGRTRSAGLDTAAQAALIRPGSNGRGPASGLGRFYEALLRGGDGLITPASVALFTQRQRVGMFDETFQHVLDWGLGFILDSNRYGVETVPYGYGRFCGPHTFGHSGSQSSAAFCDPDQRLVVAWICNGMPGEAAHQARCRTVNSLIYADLGIAGRDEAGVRSC